MSAKNKNAKKAVFDVKLASIAVNQLNIRFNHYLTHLDTAVYVLQCHKINYDTVYACMCTHTK